MINKKEKTKTQSRVKGGTGEQTSRAERPPNLSHGGRYNFKISAVTFLTSCATFYFYLSHMTWSLYAASTISAKSTCSCVVMSIFFCKLTLLM